MVQVKKKSKLQHLAHFKDSATTDCSGSLSFESEESF